MALTETIGIAEIKSGNGGTAFTCEGLGSSIAICMLDPVAEVSVMSHVMLPASLAGRSGDHPAKYANTAIPEMLRVLVERGGAVSDTSVAYAGGAQVLRIGNGDTNRIDIGARNAAAVAEALASAGFRTVAADVGGSCGRTVVFEAKSGKVRVKTYAVGDRELCNLRSDVQMQAA